MDIFWGHHKIGLYLGVISMHFRVFIKDKVQNGGYFRRLLKFQTFFGVLEILDIFWGRTVDAGPAPTYTEKIRVGLPPGDVVSNN